MWLNTFDYFSLCKTVITNNIICINNNYELWMVHFFVNKTHSVLDVGGSTETLIKKWSLN